VRLIAGLARGHTRRRIAADLGIPEETVFSRLRGLGMRLRISGAIQPVLVHYGYGYGYLADLAPEEPRQAQLTARQETVLRMTAHGFTVQEIAAALVLSVNTVGTHRRRLYRMLGARSAAHAVALGWQAGVLHHRSGRRVASASSGDRPLAAAGDAGGPPVRSAA